MAQIALSIWTKPKKMVDENFLITEVDSYSAKLINQDKIKDLALLKLKITNKY